MAVGLSHTLYCDRPGCRSKLTVTDTRNAAHAREVARRTFGWRTDRGERCPEDLARATNVTTGEAR